MNPLDKALDTVVDKLSELIKEEDDIQTKEPLDISNYCNNKKNVTFYQLMRLQGGPKKSLLCDLEEKCLRKSKIFFDGVFLSIYSHLVKNLELSKLSRKKVMGL